MLCSAACAVPYYSGAIVRVGARLFQYLRSPSGRGIEVIAPCAPCAPWLTCVDAIRIEAQPWDRPVMRVGPADNPLLDIQRPLIRWPLSSSIGRSARDRRGSQIGRAHV